MEPNPWEFGWDELIAILSLAVVIFGIIAAAASVKKWQKEKRTERRFSIAEEILEKALDARLTANKVLSFGITTSQKEMQNGMFRKSSFCDVEEIFRRARPLVLELQDCSQILTASHFLADVYFDKAVDEAIDLFALHVSALHSKYWYLATVAQTIQKSVKISTGNQDYMNIPFEQLIDSGQLPETIAETFYLFVFLNSDRCEEYLNELDSRLQIVRKELKRFL